MKSRKENDADEKTKRETYFYLNDVSPLFYLRLHIILWRHNI